MKYSKRRDLREKLMKASSTKCYGDKFDNAEYVKKIASLKHKRANILGYDNYADYVLEKITRIQKYWTDHRSTHWLPFHYEEQGGALDEVARTLVLSIHLDSETVENVNGDAYIDDIEIEFN